MNISELKLDQDYSLLTSWWAGWELPAIPKHDLPETGFMASLESKPIVAAFWVITNAIYCFVTTFVADPKSSWQQRQIAIKLLLDDISSRAKKAGFKRILIIPEKENLRDKLGFAGFEVYPNKLFLCIKEL